MNRNKFDFNALDNAERDMIMRMIGRVQTEAEHDIKNAGYDPFSYFQRYNPGKEPYKMLIVRMTELGHALMNDRNDLKPCIDVNESYDYIMRMHNRSNNPINIREYNTSEENPLISANSARKRMEWNHDHFQSRT